MLAGKWTGAKMNLVPQGKKLGKSSSLTTLLILQVFVIFIVITIAIAVLAFNSQSSLGHPSQEIQQSAIPLISSTPNKSTPISSTEARPDQESSSEATNNIGGPPPGLVRCMAEYAQAHDQASAQHDQLRLNQLDIEARMGALNAEWMATGLASVGNGLPTPEFQARFDALQAEYDYTINTMRTIEQRLNIMQPRDFNCE